MHVGMNEGHEDSLSGSRRPQGFWKQHEFRQLGRALQERGIKSCP